MTLDLVDHLTVGPDGLHEADSNGVNSLGVLGDDADLVGNLVLEPQQVANLLEKCDDLRVKVDTELQYVTLGTIAGNLEQRSRDRELATSDLGEPCLIDGPSIQFLL